MYLTHSNLRGLTLKLKTPQPVFAGDAALLEVTLVEEDARPRYGIGLRAQRTMPRSRRDKSSRVDEGVGAQRMRPQASALDAAHPGWAWTDVPPLAHVVAQVSFQPARRGWHGVPTLAVETRFPLGIFRVWTLWRPAAQLLAYPRPEPYPPPLPAVQPVPGGPALARTREGSETEGIRGYRRGDPLKLVVWKKVAKTGELVSRDTASAAHQELWLEYQAATALDSEQRLSRLTAWVLAADRAGLRYGLRLPGRDIAPAEGEAHRRACLEALALWQ
jgi:hypothetical protein